MKILGIDPGVERVGIAVIEKTGAKETYIYSECFKTSSKLPHSKRIALIGEEIEKIISDYKPTGLAIEKLFFEKNTTTAMSVAEARGVIIFVAEKFSLNIFEYTPLEIKVAVTGYGKSDKKAVMAMVPRLIKLPDSKMIDDEMDAIAVAITCFAHEKLA